MLLPYIGAVLALWLLLAVTGLHGSCIHDQIQPDTVPVSTLQYRSSSHRHDDKYSSQTEHSLDNSKNKINYKYRRKRVVEAYEPIRIIAHYENLGLSENEEGRLRNTVNMAITRISNLLSVIHVQGPLLLSREACNIFWSDGPNAGRCQELKVGYRDSGEKCGPDDFVIPREHLSGFSTYGYNASQPNQQHFSDGPGLLAADYVVYIQARSTGSCSRDNFAVMAYASYCRQDQNGRPVAGYVNFCPTHLNDGTFEENKAVLTMIHELFHALGFSKNLLDEYRDCSHSASGLNCPKRHRVTGSIYRVERIITPTHVTATSQHYNCTTHPVNEFGAPLHLVNSNIDSHWDARFLQGSIMAPSIGLPHLTFIDNMTMSLFEDMGWYKVNYQEVDDYHWGKDEGCDFGLQQACNDESEFFCTGNDLGCHYLHLDKAQCSKDDFLGSCRIFIAQPGGACFLPFGASVSLGYGEVHSSNSRCFLSNLTLSGTNGAMDYSGRCYEHRCAGINQVEVRVGNSSWIPCPGGDMVEIPGLLGSLLCPMEGVLCATLPSSPRPRVTPQSSSSSSSLPPSSSTSTTPSTTTIRVTVKDPSSSVTAELTFNINYTALVAAGRVDSFQKAVIKEVLKAIKITSDRIDNISVREGSVIVQFDILPATYEDQGPLVKTAYAQLAKLVKEEQFKVEYLGEEIKPLSLRSTNLNTDSPFRLGAAAVVGIVIASLIVFSLFVVIVVAINKYKVRHRQGEGGSAGSFFSISVAFFKTREGPV
ncbi:uncharacterized protein LOC106173638 isoform X2 [Lingula anatina]|uniref:Leishmanolysin-like peptidase n=1 Tax=Lingula anatina TaxID=7574 RepID=A0A1S3JJI1_LINAN|nr:uncharacterized protein LOC106173638 isoform X2 [Lingula anatina]|eukprot:XP_013410286.1 uncharacterized protein LOC106173638 isoform X2 [Lingula anatina]